MAFSGAHAVFLFLARHSCLLVGILDDKEKNTIQRCNGNHDKLNLMLCNDERYQRVLSGNWVYRYGNYRMCAIGYVPEGELTRDLQS